MSEKSIDNKLTENEQTILGILFSVKQYPIDSKTNEYLISENRRIRLNEEGIRTVSNKRLGDQINKLPSIIKSLLFKKMLIEDNDLFNLTELGIIIGKKVKTKWSSELYDDLLIRCANSLAYAQFCERAYGRNLLQFNVIDMCHLDMLLDKLKLSTDDVVLDLGCGLGKITEFIAQTTSSKIIGIDSSQKAIEWAQNNTRTNKKLIFDVKDINELDYPPASFDVIIALDVLYWIDDLEPVIRKLKDILKPDSRMAFFYVLFRTKNDPIESLEIKHSKLGKFLEQNNFDYELIDISQRAIDIWKEKIVVGQELRSQFESEGNLDIIDDRLKGGENVIKNFENQLQKRYFIYVENK
ncbi:MAG: class I SAM-dependent methyltransferase [Asgard group archaeon]|nr:class I SAM-dependent methyltransferase [Asgard group archaeon]